MKRIIVLIIVTVFLFSSIAEARYYSTATRRFLSEDPIGFNGGDVNFYAYVGNNPVNFTDPLGLDAVNAGIIFNWGRGLFTSTSASDGPGIAGDIVGFGILAGTAAVAGIVYMLPPDAKALEGDWSGEAIICSDETPKINCEPQYQQDINTCKARWSGKDNQLARACYQHAAVRKALCEQGLPVPPLQP